MSLVRIADGHLGWRRDGEIVANARIRREDGGFHLDALEADDAAAASELVDAIAAAATGLPRIVGADPSLSAHGFEERDGRWVRELTIAPDDEAARSVTLAELEAAIRSSWTREISEEPDKWSEDNPAWGTCAATALVVRDYLGGELVIAGVVADGVRIDRHVWNVLPSGLAVDLSRDQFRNGERFEAPEPLTETAVPGTDERYELLAASVRERLSRR
jgi:hypothetical protein